MADGRTRLLLPLTKFEEGLTTPHNEAEDDVNWLKFVATTALTK